jgi:hypothetical protein
MANGTMRKDINIQPVLMNAEQVHSYLGGNIGINRIIALMKNNIIPTVNSGGKGLLLTRKQDVDEFIEYMFRKPINNKIIDTYPLKMNMEFAKNA